MKLFQRLFGVGKKQGGAQEIVEGILCRYDQRRQRGEWRADDKLYVELQQVLPPDTAREIYERFRRRSVCSDPQAAYLLGVELATALHDVEHNAATSKPIFVQRQVTKPAPDSTPPSAAKTCAKVVNGEAIDDEDEDAMIFGEWLGR